VTRVREVPDLVYDHHRFPVLPAGSQLVTIEVMNDHIRGFKSGLDDEVMEAPVRVLVRPYIVCHPPCV
jgi:hypothetical protein